MNRLTYMLQQIGVCLMIQESYSDGFYSGVDVGADWSTTRADHKPKFEVFKKEQSFYI